MLGVFWCKYVRWSRGFVLVLHLFVCVCFLFDFFLWCLLVFTFLFRFGLHMYVFGLFVPNLFGVLVSFILFT